jgi:hypothetical protein
LEIGVHLQKVLPLFVSHHLFENEERIFKRQMPFPAPGSMQRASSDAPPSCTVVHEHFSLSHQRTVDHFHFQKMMVLTCCHQGMIHEKQVSTVMFHYWQQRLLSR